MSTMMIADEPKRGRPTRGASPSTPVTVRLTREERDAAVRRGWEEGMVLSETIRAALLYWMSAPRDERRP
ncbi:hypothetical protein DO944_06110 [Microbacterium sp. SMR1]|nr:hypothetical protein DO944_06110 [Microbacterium sp. SMR1]